MEDHTALSDALDELKRNLERAQLRGANGDVFYA